MTGNGIDISFTVATVDLIQFDWSIIVIADRISLCQDPGVTHDDVFYSDASDPHLF